MKKDIAICFIILIVTAALCTLCAVMLPQEVVVQVDLRGHPSNVMSKSAAIILPVALSVGGVVLFGINRQRKSYALSAVGILVMIITLIVNR